MAKKHKLEFTNAQLVALIELTDTMAGMIGVGSEFDAVTTKQVKLIDRVLEKHGYTRYFK